MLDHLPAKSYLHAVVCQDSSGDMPEILRSRNCEIHEIGTAPSLLSPGWYRRGIKVAQNFCPDIVHGGVIEGNALANVIGMALPAAKVISEETSHPLERKARTEVFLRLLFLRSDAVIGVSPVVVDYLQDRLHIPSRKLHLIDNGVGPAPLVTSKGRGQLRHELGLEADDFVIGTVGRIQDDDKRMSDLIRAMPRVHQACAKARLVIIGEGVDLGMLERLAEELRVRPLVRFTGYRGNPRPYYSIMDMFALVSATEAFGLVLVEAMLAAVPVVGTKVGGIPYVLNNGNAGRLISPFAPVEIATTVIEMISNPKERLRLANAGLVFAQNNFSAERYASNLDKLYLQVLGANV